MKRELLRGAGLLVIGALLSGAAVPAMAQTGDAERLNSLEQRIADLEQMNQRLLAVIEDMQNGGAAPAPVVAPAVGATDIPPPEPTAELPAPAPAQAAARPEIAPPVAAGEPETRGSVEFVGLDPDYSYRMFDHAEGVNSKPLIQLRTKQAGGLADRITLGAGLTVIADYQHSDTNSKFGYLTRHPTAANQIGKDVSEAVIHSASLALTARLTGDLTGYMEFLYDPQQSFGSGTLTDLNRNQIQLRRGWIMWGDLDRRPVYALIGKMDTPFGLNDTVNPFTNSTSWHSFAGLAYGAQLGWFSNGLHVRAMAIQGGSQFRAANTPVAGTNVPSRLNNYALDASYTASFDQGSAMVGGSYERGSPYCQDYPVFHFNPCADNVPAWAAYGRLNWGGLTLMGEYGRTTKVWAGTAVPAADPRLGAGAPVTPPQQVWTVSPNPLSVFPAVKPEAFTVGARYAFGPELSSPISNAMAVSLEFSRFIAGADGSPWEKQSQWVLGGSYYLSPSINLFGELIHVDGYVPLNFLSGGNFANGGTWSVQNADTDVVLVGAQAAF